MGIAVADFDGDGAKDIAVANGETHDVSILFNTNNASAGYAAFAPAVHVPVLVHPLELAAGDLNSDGRPDLAVVDFASIAVTVLLNTGKGLFSESKHYAATRYPTGIDVFDSNLDGKLDLAVSSDLGLVTIGNVSRLTP